MILFFCFKYVSYICSVIFDYDTMIEVKDLNFSYSKARGKVLSELSLSIKDGNVYGLLGRNGVGKTTLLYLLMGLLKPQSGSVIMDGENVAQRNPSSLSDMFIIPDEEFSLPAVSLKSFIKHNKVFYPNFSEEIFNNCMRDYEMPNAIGHLDALSHGQKKKVFISFAFATQTQLLAMDEPTNGLDIIAKSAFRKHLLQHMNEKRTIIISTHQVRDLDQMLDHVIIIDENRLLLNESTARIAQKLSFKCVNTPEEAVGAFYSQPTVQGRYVVVENIDGEETDVNIETLFNAVLLNQSKMKELFNA